MSAISQWVKNLVFIILFTTLLEMFLPENNMRKYVRVVMGFFIITVFISPLAVIFNQDLTTIDRIIPGNIINDNWEEIKRRGEEIENANRSLLKGYYEERIEERVREIIELNYSEYGQVIEVGVNEEYQITYIDITLIKQDSIERVEIKPVEIGREKPEEKKASRMEMVELKKKISRIFQVPINLINIRVKDGRE